MTQAVKEKKETIVEVKKSLPNYNNIYIYIQRYTIYRKLCIQILKYIKYANILISMTSREYKLNSIHTE